MTPEDTERRKKLSAIVEESDYPDEIKQKALALIADEEKDTDEVKLEVIGLLQKATEAYLDEVGAPQPTQEELDEIKIAEGEEIAAIGRQFDEDMVLVEEAMTESRRLIDAAELASIREKLQSGEGDSAE